MTAPTPAVDRIVATPDPPPTGIVNPIHDAEGADGAGYAGALVAGVRTYGWAAQTITRALGAGWLNDGWADVSLRRPLFAGETVTITVTPPDSGDAEPNPTWTVSCVGSGAGGERVVLDGTVGLGNATWRSELDPPAVADGEDPPEIRPTYDLDTVPLRRPLRPLRAHLKVDAARRLVADDLGIDDPRYAQASPPPVHPYFLAGRMAPLTRHNFTYGPTIHVRTQIQHTGPARSGQDIVVGAQIVDAYERNDHWYQVLDGVVSDGAGATVAVIRHHTIFRPRGTTLPPPTDPLTNS